MYRRWHSGARGGGLQFRALKARKAEADNSLKAMMPRSVRDGIDRVESLAAGLPEGRVHGPLIDLMLVSPKCDGLLLLLLRCGLSGAAAAARRLFTAVEAVAANQLFNVVVEDDEVADQLIGELSKSRAGRVTFMPLNRLAAPASSAPLCLCFFLCVCVGGGGGGVARV